LNNVCDNKNNIMKKKINKKEFKEIILKDALYSLEEEHGLHEDIDQSYKRFQNKYKKKFGSSFIIKIQNYFINKMSTTTKLLISLIAGFSLAFVPIANMTVRNLTNSLLDDVKQYIHTESKSIDFTHYINTDYPFEKANKIIKEAVKLKLKTDVSYSDKEIRLTISGLKSFETNQDALKDLINIQTKRQGNILLIIELQ